MCILCQQTSPKRWFGNRTMMSFCDVTNSAHQIQMTTLCRWMKPPPMKSFCVRHWARRLGNCRQTKNTTRTNLKNQTRVCAFLIKYVYLYNFIRFNDMAVIKIRTLHKWFLLTKSTSTGFSTGYKKGCSKFIVGLLRKNSVTRRGSGLTKRSNFNII